MIRLALHGGAGDAAGGADHAEHRAALSRIASEGVALLRAGKRASYAELSTDLGHDSFLLESEDLYSLVRGFLERDQPYGFDYSI